MVRWDSPLFTLLLEDELPGEQIAEALSSSDIKPPNSGTLSVGVDSHLLVVPSN